MSGPPKKRPRRVTRPVTEAVWETAQREWKARQEEDAAKQAEMSVRLEHEEEAQRRAESAFRIGQVLDAVKTTGYRTLHEFLAELLATKDQHQSSQVSQMLILHGHELLDLIHSHRLEVVTQWISKAAGSILRLSPPQNQSVTATLQNFSLESVLADAEYIAPTLCMLLRTLTQGSDPENLAGGERRRNTDLWETHAVQGNGSSARAPEFLAKGMQQPRALRV
ncbi:hypothetical protein B0H17DRAFT_1137076 [Mycena rosella]|uniref:Uncharacterized protein n=1 Tax=Mycena rosella TaxID=1033263 RepID=A0AAD7GB90_MYCRO|nr:hypothetical protein B0H17DRAFT_1137076 [Mycena rosella]